MASPWGAAVNDTVRDNSVRSNAVDGIIVSGGSNANTLTDNSSNKNGHDGILVMVSTFGNTFKGNSAFGNTAFDAEDQLHGTGTALTANTWTDNDGDTASPPGILNHGHGHGQGGND